MTRLVIADDHPLLIDGLVKLLQEIEDVEVVAAVNNGLELISTLRKQPADIVLLDLQMPKLDGIATIKILKKDFPKLKIIVFTNYDQPKLVREIRAMGANAFLAKNSPSILLKDVVSRVAAGGVYFQNISTSPEPPPALVDDFMKKYQLTARETEIIRKIAEGLTSKQISLELSVSEFTINTHRRNICRKLNIYTPVGLLNFAKKHGILS